MGLEQDEQVALLEFSPQPALEQDEKVASLESSPQPGLELGGVPDPGRRRRIARNCNEIATNLGAISVVPEDSISSYIQRLGRRIPSAALSPLVRWLRFNDEDRLPLRRTCALGSGVRLDDVARI
jgi:hypothetical protein